MDSLSVEFDKRPDNQPIVWMQCCSSLAPLNDIMPGTLILARHFGAPIYLEVLDVNIDSYIKAVIVELGPDVYNEEIISVFERRYVLRLNEEYIFSCSAPASRYLVVGLAN